jgi:NTE family protein
MSVALVLAGGGARGAYEAGALSVLLPELEQRGERPSLFVGTSVGAINATFLAATQQLPAEQSAERLLALWGNLRKEEVIRPILQRQGPLAVLRYAGELLSIPGVRLNAMLDPAPLRGNLEGWIDWDQLDLNVAAGWSTRSRRWRRRHAPAAASCSSSPRRRATIIARTPWRTCRHGSASST